MSPLDTPPERPDWSLLSRYAAGDATPAEARAVDAWIAGAPERAAFVDSLRTMVTESARLAERATPDVDAMWRRAATRIGVPQVVAGRGRQRTDVSVRWASAFQSRGAWSSLAAALLVAAVVYGAVALSGGATREYRTALGERRAVTLDDGTRLTLAPGSRLAVGARYAHGRRDVTLDGEAYFTVVHDAAMPFVVHAGNASVTDIGTRFDVRAYALDHSVRVVVAEGAVALRAVAGWSSARVVRAGASGEVESDGSAGTFSYVVADDYLGWTTGRLVFKAAPLDRVLADLGRYYDLDLRAATATFGARSINGTFIEETPAAMLDAVALLLDARYVRNGRRVTFLPR